MRIRKIELVDDPILGSTLLDFTDPAGHVVNTIILAGENGTGKSYLLNIIYELSLYGMISRPESSKRSFELELSESEMTVLLAAGDHQQFFKKYDVSNQLVIGVDLAIKDRWEQFTVTLFDKKGRPIPTAPTLFHPDPAKKILKTIFSDVEINFTPKDIANVTSKNIDTHSASERSNNSLATDITQLLIDVQSVDALEFTQWAIQATETTFTKGQINTRLKRFTSAFHYMFPTKRYKNIETIGGRKHVIFEENGREMSIDKLSSGEKQVVFRGGFLLKNKESSKGALILIDEPEISLHPSWQLKILNFFKKLFTDSEGNQTSQLIVSTHSPFVIHNSNRINDKVIVLKKNAAGKTEVLTNPVFPGWTNERMVQDAFNIETMLNDTKVKVFVEGETDEKYFKKALEVFSIDPHIIDFKWIGRNTEKGKPENTGDTALNQARVFFMANIELIKNIVVLLYDSDTNKPEETFHTLHVRVMPKKTDNKVFKIGIENLLLVDGIDLTKFYREKKNVDDYGAESLIRTLDKQSFCDHVCAFAPEKLKYVLSNLEKEIKRLVQIDAKK